MKNNFKIFISIVLLIFNPLKLKAKEEDHKNNELKNLAINIPKEINQKSHISKNISNFLNLLASNLKKNSDDSKEDFNIEIISDIQFSEENKFYAKGNVLAKSKNLVLEADEIIYDSKSKIILIER